MMTHSKRFVLYSATLLGLLFSTLAIAQVPVDPSFWTGSRTAPTGIFSTAAWNPGFTVGWEISQTGSTYHYLYNVSVPSKNISHFLLGVSPTFTKDNIFNFQSSSGTLVGPDTFGNEGGSNPSIPSPIYSIKVDAVGALTLSFSFDSDRSPIWGSFYSKDGKDGGVDVFAYNLGFGTDPNPGGPFTNWIPTPDTNGVPVPEPATLTVLGAGVALAAWAKRRRAKTA